MQVSGRVYYFPCSFPQPFPRCHCGDVAAQKELSLSSQLCRGEGSGRGSSARMATENQTIVVLGRTKVAVTCRSWGHGGEEGRHGYRYTQIYVVCVCVCACCYPAHTLCGKAGRGKPKTKSKQRTSKTERGETDKLVVGEAPPCSMLHSPCSVRSGHCVCHLAVALHSIWGQLGKVFAVSAGADRRHKKAQERG